MIIATGINRENQEKRKTKSTQIRKVCITLNDEGHILQHM